MIRKILACCFCLLFLAHFSILAVYNAPSNPVQAKYKKEINTYVDPLFTQNWKLFAPTPVTTSNYFYVKARVKSNTKVRTTEWIDIVDYMYKENHKNRFSPYNRLLRIPRGAYALQFQQDGTLISLMKKIKEGKLEPEKYEHLFDNDEKKAEEERANEILNRYAEAQLLKLFPDQEILQYKVLLVEKEPVPFSKKDDKNYKTKETYLELDWNKPEKIGSVF
jgi:hypothetical protein